MTNRFTFGVRTSVPSRIREKGRAAVTIYANTYGEALNIIIDKPDDPVYNLKGKIVSIYDQDNDIWMDVA